ncbi:MAG: hypothetical protein AAF228_11515, partial [Pseudomonadota bacterium]
LKIFTFIITSYFAYSFETAYAAVSFTCEYTHMAVLKDNYRKFSAHGMRIEKNQKKLVLRFLIDKKAYLIGNNGTEVVKFSSSKSGLITLIETTPTGNKTITSIDLLQKTSVHSRHILMPGTLLPSQYYGTCTYKR